MTNAIGIFMISGQYKGDPFVMKLDKGSSVVIIDHDNICEQLISGVPNG